MLSVVIGPTSCWAPAPADHGTAGLFRPRCASISQGWPDARADLGALTLTATACQCWRPSRSARTASGPRTPTSAARTAGAIPRPLGAVTAGRRPLANRGPTRRRYLEPATGHRLSVDTAIIFGHGAGVHPNLARRPSRRTDGAAVSGDNPLPAALRLLPPSTGDHAGPADCIVGICGAAGRTQKCRYSRAGSVPRWPDVSEVTHEATGTRAVTGAPRPAWLDRCGDEPARDRGGSGPSQRTR